MQKPINLLKDQMVGIRDTVNANLIDTVRVNNQPLKHLAFSANHKAGVHVTPYDPAMVSSIEKALKLAGFYAYAFSKQTVVVTVPPRTVEQRKEIERKINLLGEETRIAIRNIRKNYKQGWVREKLDKTELSSREKKLQSLTDEVIKEADKLVREKIGTLC